MRALAASLPARLRLPRVSLPSLSPRARRRALVAVVLAALLTGLYMLWFRDSSFVEVEEVTISGLTTDDGGRVRSALEAEALRMTTLHVRHDRLERVIEGYPAVQAIEVDAGFPSKLSIRVIEWRPVAIAVAGSRRVAIGAEGGLLKGVPLGRSLPTVDLKGSLPADKLGPGAQLRAVSVLAGAPEALRPKLAEAAEEGDRGIVVQMRDGPELIFGDSSGIAAKWTAAARVLADPASRGASYVDLRLPDRPVAGGLPPEQAAPLATEEAQAPPEPAPAPGAAPAPVAPTPQAAPPVPQPTPEPAAPAVPQSQP